MKDTAWACGYTPAIACKLAPELAAIDSGVGEGGGGGGGGGGQGGATAPPLFGDVCTLRPGKLEY